MAQSYSLTRLLAEIKAINATLTQIPLVVATAPNGTGIIDGGTATIEEFKRVSQSRFDSWVGLFDRLAKLIAARNKANATTQVVISGKTMTIDEAILWKNSVQQKRQGIEAFKSQLNQAANIVKNAEAKVTSESATATQNSVTSGRQSSLSQEEMDSLTKHYQKLFGRTAAVVDAVKVGIENMEDQISRFLTEVDYVLSEANAKTIVEIE